MKKKILLAFAILFVCIQSYSQNSWVRLSHPANTRYDNIQFTCNDTGYIRSPWEGYKLFKTVNNGNNWSQVTLPQNYSLGSFYFLNSGRGIICGRLFSRGAVYRTTNGGNNWTQVFIEDSVTGSYYAQYTNITFVDSYTGFIAGRNGNQNNTAYKTTDSGNSWNLIPSAFPTVIKMKFLNNSVGFILSTGATLFKTTNSGINWVMKTAGITDQFYDITFLNENTGYVSGNNSLIMKTTNAGDNWTILNLQISSYSEIYSIAFTTPDTGYYVKGTFNESRIYKTINGGYNWLAQSSSFNNNNLKMIYFINRDTGFAVGDSIILRTFDGGGPIGLNYISSEIPVKFSLHQNYPNPFNPVTKIKFDLPKSSNVTIKIYDAIGREVSTLVNEKLNAGVYSVDWDGANYPSGVYFYQITSGSYIETKKMILIK